MSCVMILHSYRAISGSPYVLVPKVLAPRVHEDFPVDYACVRPDCSLLTSKPHESE